MTHAASFGFVALFVVCAARWVPRGATVRQSLILGALLGLAFLARSQESLFALYPAVLVLSAAGRPAGERVRRALTLAGWAFLGALPWILLQLGHSYVLFTRYEYSLLGAGRLPQSLALALDRHAVLVVARLPVVDPGRLCRGRRHVRLPAPLRGAGRRSALLILFLTAWVNGATLGLGRRLVVRRAPLLERAGDAGARAWRW